VTLMGSWPEGVAALREHGVRLVEADGSERAYPVRVVTSPAEVVARGRIALVLVKAWQTERAARQLRDCLAPDGLAVTLQNGIGNLEALAGALGRSRCAVGVTTLGANLLEPGRARAAGEGMVTLEEHPRSERIVSLLATAGLEVATTLDVTALLWGKLVINAAINPLTALLRIPNGELLERPTVRSLMAVTAQEAAAVAAAQEIALPYPDPVCAVEAVAQRTAANHSSMLQDVLRGAPTEVDAINGAVARAGERSGVPTPVNRALWGLVKGLGGRG